jgi:hypothetical protein
MLLSFKPPVDSQIIALLGTSPGLSVPELQSRLTANQTSVSIPGLYRTLRELREQGVVIRSSGTFSLSQSWLREVASWTRIAAQRQRKQDLSALPVLRSIEALKDEFFEGIVSLVETGGARQVRIIERLPILSLCEQGPLERLQRVLTGMGCVLNHHALTSETERICRMFKKSGVTPACVVIIGERALILSCNHETEQELALGTPTPQTVRRIRNRDARFTLRLAHSKKETHSVTMAIASTATGVGCKPDSID